MHGGKPQLSSWFLYTHSSYGVVKYNDSVTTISRRSEVCKPLNPPTSVVAVDLVDHIDVEVLTRIPATDSFL